MFYPDNHVIGLELRHIAYALAIAVIAYIIREVRRRRRDVRPRRPGLTMEEAWNHWGEGAPNHPDAGFIPANLTPARTPDNVRQDARRNLYEMEEAILDSDNQRYVLRRMILANATLALQLEAITAQEEGARAALVKGYEAGMEQLLRDAVTASTLKWLVLRDYARWRFDDAVSSDWFHQYMHLAHPYIREKVRLAKEFMLEADAGAGKFAEVYDTLLGELRDRSLKTRPKRRFVRPDVPWD